MLSEVASNRVVLLLPRRRPGPLYPKLRPGPRTFAGETVASNQRARLYGAMIELVAARGYEASTVAELCALAGVSKRTLYERFPGGKQQCFLATYDIIVHRAETHILLAGRCELEGIVGVGPVERLRGLVEAFAHDVAAYPNAARLALVEASDAGPGGARTQRAHDTTGRAGDLLERSCGLRHTGAFAAHGQADRGGWNAARARTLARRSHRGAYP